jgi:glyoxylase-like metal-dependent hydrolase (beta-lactamase superfamily II)
MDSLVRYAHTIYAFDAHYVRPLLASVHLIVEGGRAAFIDTGSNDSLPNALAALGAIGLGTADVDYVFLTHIHLDHAGGAGAMMRAFPNAKLVVHPRGARHMVEPSKLVAGAAKVYGATEVRRLYGEVLPIDEHRIIEARHKLKIDLAGRELLCLDTPGHAKHHICIVDGRSGHIFTGDTFGLSYREFDVDGRQFIFPTTTPVQFDPPALHASLDLLMSYRPAAMYLTHYSQVTDVAAKAEQLHRLIYAHLEIARREQATGTQRHSRIQAALTDLLLTEARQFGCILPAEKMIEIYATDLDLNAQGLCFWLDNRESRA